MTKVGKMGTQKCISPELNVIRICIRC